MAMFGISTVQFCTEGYDRSSPNNPTSMGESHWPERLVGAIEPVSAFLSLFLDGRIHFLTGMSY